MRMCICCRQMMPKKEMLRVVKTQSGEISLDLTGKLAGRGAYLCNSEACVLKLKKTRALSRAFSCEVSDEVYTKMEEAWRARNQS
ncbi:MAG: YlxR family protein [Clostridia bacterium]|nr:YlxR family protein [Clostridia bacterium]